MKMLAMNKPLPGATLDAILAIADQELARDWDLYQSGLYREMYERADGQGSVLVLEADDVATAQAALDSLPMVKAGLIAFDVIPLVPFAVLDRLFVREQSAD